MTKTTALERFFATASIDVGDERAYQLQQQKCEGYCKLRL